jgi:hypothetical protein
MGRPEGYRALEFYGTRQVLGRVDAGALPWVQLGDTHDSVVAVERLILVQVHRSQWTMPAFTVYRWSDKLQDYDWESTTALIPANLFTLEDIVHYAESELLTPLELLGATSLCES